MGVYENSKGTTDGAGVMGEHKGAGIGVMAISQTGGGLVAVSTGFKGRDPRLGGIIGQPSGEAIHAENQSPDSATIAAVNKDKSNKAKEALT